MGIFDWIRSSSPLKGDEMATNIKAHASSTGLGVRKIRTQFETDAGTKVNQSGWMTLERFSFQTEFGMTFRSGPEFSGVFRVIFDECRITGLVFLVSPSDVLDNYDFWGTRMVNYLSIGGEYPESTVSFKICFEHVLQVVSKYNLSGWAFEFSSGFEESGLEIDAEMIVSDMICAKCITIQFGKRANRHSQNTTDVWPITSIYLRDIPGLRLAICDNLGQQYLDRLLRRRGYEIVED
ncbi:MAG: hypothetical protein ACR65Z_12485 [Methylocystis sp.]